MPIENILYLCLVFGAMIEFAAVLAYAESVWDRAPKSSAPTLVHSAPERPAPVARNLVGDKAA